MIRWSWLGPLHFHTSRTIIPRQIVEPLRAMRRSGFLEISRGVVGEKVCGTARPLHEMSLDAQLELVL
jgi:hypothetical protein